MKDQKTQISRGPRPSAGTSGGKGQVVENAPYWDWVVWGCIALYVVGMSVLCAWRYHTFNYYDFDLASDVVVYFNSLHGRFLYYPFFQQSILSAHLYLIAVPLMLIFALAQYPLTVLVLQSAALGLSAYPLYLLARMKLNRMLACVICAAYLLYAPIGYMNIFEAHFDAFKPLFLLFAMFYFERALFWRFFLCLLLAVFCKENTSLVMVMFGVYAVLRRRSLRWIIPPFVLGAAWFFLAIKVVIPAFTPDEQFYQGGFMLTEYYKHLGSNLGEMIRRIFFDPVYIFQFVTTPIKLTYFFQLLLPTGFLVVLSPLVLINSFLIFLQNLLSSNTNHAMIEFQYTGDIFPFIFVSVVFAVSKLIRWGWLRNAQIPFAASYLAWAIGSAFYLKAPQVDFPRYLKEWRYDDLNRQRDRLLSLIPKDASVTATFQFMPKLSARKELHSFHFISTGMRFYSTALYEPPSDLEYALVDFYDKNTITYFTSPRSPQNIRGFLEQGEWRVVSAIEENVLFKKAYLDGPKLVEIVDEPDIQNRAWIDLNGQFVYLGYDVAGYDRQQRILHLVHYWKKTGPKPPPLGYFLQILDERGQVLMNKVHMFGYRAYSPEVTPMNAIMKEQHYLSIPSGYAAERIVLRGGLFFIGEGGRIFSFLDGAATEGFQLTLSTIEPSNM